VNDGYVFEMTLDLAPIYTTQPPSNQPTLQGYVIVGRYDVGRRDGAISNGVVNGDTLTFDWVQTGTIKGSGKGSFQLVNPNEMRGSWTFANLGGGTWTARRQ
jgi:hypothetical protein